MEVFPLNYVLSKPGFLNYKCITDWSNSYLNIFRSYLKKIVKIIPK